MQVRIGVSDAPRAIELEVEDPSVLIEDLESAFSEGRHLLHFSDLDGRKIVVPLAKLAYLEVESEKHRMVGFAKASG